MIDLSLEHLIVLLETYKYLILFPIAIFEGPIATVVAGFLTTLGILNVYLIFAVVVAADLAGDTIYYCLGYWGGRPLIAKYGTYFRVTPERLSEAEIFFNTNQHKTVVLSKLIHGIGFMGLIAAGSLKIPFYRYIAIALPVSLVQSAAFLLIGILFGHAYVYIEGYLSTFAAVVSIAVLAIIVFFITRAILGRH